jgi:hypothetical protein
MIVVGSASLEQEVEEEHAEGEEEDPREYADECDCWRRRDMVSDGSIWGQPPAASAGKGPPDMTGPLYAQDSLGEMFAGSSIL